MRMAADAVWREEDSALVRDYEFKDFAAAMAFVNRVADVAEEVNHHPDILVHGWNKVRLTLTTHSEGGLTDSDRAMAERIDGLG
jgi:4a-hydroxytetrahydrobiopterin dehydratase